MIFRRKSKLFGKPRKSSGEITPDNIFLDSKNLPKFDEDQFEGRVEKSISKRVVTLVGCFFILVVLVYSYKIWGLQLVKGKSFLSSSENNHLQHSIVFAKRGIVYDRNGIELVCNSSDQEEGQLFFEREYHDYVGLAHVLGYVSYPLKDKNGNYYQDEYIGKSGVEKFFNEKLSGKNGLKIVEKDALLNTKSESVVQLSEQGDSIYLSIDIRVQEALYGFIADLSKKIGFNSGAGVLMDVHNGEILALASYPEYDLDVMSNGNDQNEIARYIMGEGEPFLNRVTMGLYTPGSIVKPFLAIAALNEEIISPNKKILSTGSISIPNPYFPEEESVFKDWKAHGWVNMRDAIAVSSNVYFYAVGGGYEDQVGLGIDNINKYIKLFGFSEETGIEGFLEERGVVPNPQWKAEMFGGENWRIGDTYHTSIGQYGFQVTPLQTVRAVGAIANSGKLYRPTVVKKNNNDKNYEVISISDDYFQIAREGMRQAVTDGSGAGLFLPSLKVSAKTGTAERGVTKEKVNSWVTGFFPSDNPRFSFTVMMEEGPRDNQIGGLYVMRQLLEWMQVNTPEYLE
ncbi:MAG: penicillin-binding transpeptidase domain-containing protein [Patescibacteria group bacterium]|nr:penicillin-binding transpeptidase domain-containing protein [Patescibacteria group bacterium]